MKVRQKLSSVPVLLMSLFSLGAGELVAQNTNPWPSNGPVGIATTSPLTDLGIGPYMFGLQRGNTSPNAGYLRFGDNSGWKFFIGRTRESIGGPVNTTTVGALMTIQDNGYVGIGTINPAQKLHVAGQYAEVEFNYNGASGGSIFLAHSRGTNASPSNITAGDYAGTILFGAFAGGAYATAGRIDSVVTNAAASTVDTALVFSPASATAGTNVESMRITSAGSVGIGTSSPGATLDVNGTIRATSITAGTVIGAVYQDVAEWVPASEDMPAGTVVVLSRGHQDQVSPSTRPYDTAVAGVVSATPGIVLGEGSADKAMIATTGRVKVRVDATQNPIEIGDLLVTGDRPGVAMKSESIEVSGRRFHQPGTILGKALESLDHGEREILVLLTLQ